MYKFTWFGDLSLVILELIYGHTDRIVKTVVVVDAIQFSLSISIYFFDIWSNMPSKYKLIYFDVTGRAEMTRLMFAAADVKYEDQRVKFADWPKLKPGKAW